MHPRHDSCLLAGAAGRARPGADASTPPCAGTISRGLAARTARVLVVAGLLVAGAGCAQDLHEGSWDTLVDARQQDAVDRGWVPEWLPEAATDVVEVNRPRTGEVVLRAHLPDDVAIDACTTTEDVSIRPELADWWQPADDGLRLTCDDGWWLVRADDTAWAWTTADPEEES